MGLACSKKKAVPVRPAEDQEQKDYTRLFKCRNALPVDILVKVWLYKIKLMTELKTF